MRSGGGRFNQRSSVSITTSGWRWSRVAKLMSLNHISMITTTTELIYSTAQVHTREALVHARTMTYTAKNAFFLVF